MRYSTVKGLRALPTSDVILTLKLTHDWPEFQSAVC